MGLFTGFNKLELRLLTISILGLSFCGLLLSNETALRWIAREQGRQTLRVLKLAVAENVVGVAKVLPYGQERAEPIEQRRDLHLGDAIQVAADSRLNFKLDQGPRVFTSGTALFRFAEFPEGDLVSLDLGSFQVEVDATIRLALRGEPYEFVGTGGQIEIQLGDEGPPRISTLSGEVHMVNIRKAALENVPEGIASAEQQIYVWKFEDIYSKEEQGFRVRLVPAKEVGVIRKLSWNSQARGPFKVQISPDAQFSEAKKVLFASENILDLDKAWIGENYWRVSADLRRWSPVVQFKLEPRFLGTTVSCLPLSVGRDAVQFKFSAEDPVDLFVLEISDDPKFSVERTTVLMAQPSGLVKKFDRLGTYHARVRGLTKVQELTEFSDPITFEVGLVQRMPATKSSSRGNRARAK